MNRLQKVLISIATLFILVIVISVVASKIVKPNQATPIRKVLPARESSVELPNDVIVASWIWEYPTQINKNIDSLLDFATQEEINTIYLYVDEYVDIYEMAEGSDKQEKMKDYQEALVNIMNESKKRNIRIQAMAGNSNYAYDSHSYIIPVLIEHVYKFNQENPGLQFEGIQFDVEFYDNERFFDSTEEYTNSFLKMVADTTVLVSGFNQQYSQDLALGFVIPFWFDEYNDYFGDPILPDILESISKLPNSYLIIMAYRNQLEEVINVAEREIEAGNESGVDIIIAQEIARNGEAKITHYGKSRDEIKRFLNELIDAEKEHPSFKGVSIHELSSFMDTI